MPVKVYDGTNWVTVAGDGAAGAPGTSSSISTWVKTASGGETSVSGTGDSGYGTLAYTVGQELVFLNGVLLDRGDDYTATSGTSIAGLTALLANDVITVWTVNSFSVANTYTVSQADTTFAPIGAVNGPAFRATRITSNQTIAAATNVKVQFNNEVYDTNNCYDPTTNYRFTPTRAGYYQVNLTLNFPSDGRTYGKIYKNGSEYGRAFSYQIADSGSSGSDLVYMNGTTDYIEFYAYLYSGSGSISTDGTQCSAVWIRG